MDAQTRVNQASFAAITFVKDSLGADLVEAQRKGMILKGVSRLDLERLIMFAGQSIDAAFQKQQASFSRVLSACLEQAAAQGVEAEASRRKK
jgi:hypothetical protein